MKHPIEWHESGLRSAENYVSRELANIKSQQDRVSAMIDHNLFYRKQIAEAKRRGMAEFDSERLLVKRTTTPADR